MNLNRPNTQDTLCVEVRHFIIEHLASFRDIGGDFLVGSAGLGHWRSAVLRHELRVAIDPSVRSGFCFGVC